MSSCTCKQDIEARMRDHIAKQHPDASDVKVSLEGYSLMLSGNTMRLKPAMNIATSRRMPKKGKPGETKLVKEQIGMTMNYCPFCGESLREVAT